MSEQLDMLCTQFVWLQRVRTRGSAILTVFHSFYMTMIQQLISPTGILATPIKSSGLSEYSSG